MLVPLLAASLLAVPACGGSGNPRPAAEPAAPTANLAPIKRYLVGYTSRLTAFTARFREQSQRYYALAQGTGFDRARLWETEAPRVGPLLRTLKRTWVDGNPLYERVEGIVAGTPSLSRYDVIIDAGANAAEDPEAAVPFDLPLGDGRVLRRPGNFYNLTEGALWGTLPGALETVASRPADLDG